MMLLPTSCALRLASVLAAAALTASVHAQGGLPPVPVPPGNPITPAKATLGKLLFWEEQMSANNRMACGTCHRPETGGGDPRRAPNPGPDGIQPSPDDTFASPGVIASDASNDYAPNALFDIRAQVTDRASPSSLTGAWFPELFWDGRAGGQFLDPETGLVSLLVGGALENQAVGPPLSRVEMAHDLRTWGQIEQKLVGARPMALATNLPPDMASAIAVNPTYPGLFTAAFGDPAITADRIARAIATYERTLVPDQTPWDLFQQGVANAMTPQQVGGMNLFNGPARCNLCHVPGLFSDRQFRNLGLRPIANDTGRQAVTGNFADRGKFKVPSLRNAGLRTGFMHTGQFVTLPQVIGFYIGGGGPNLDNKDPLLLPLGLPPQAANTLVDFVQNALVDPRVRNRQFPFDRPTLASERIPPQGFLYGFGSSGTGGIVPEILAEVPANIGNGEFRIGVAHARGAAPALLFVATAPAPLGSVFAGASLNVSPSTVVTYYTVATQGVSGVPSAGTGTVHEVLPNDPSLVGATLFVQWGIVDPGVPSGVAATRGAEVRFF